MKKLLIIGANGYIGSRLCAFFSDKNYKVTALGHSLHNNSSGQNFENITGDVRDTELLKSLAQNKFHVVINLVSLDHHKSNQDPVLVTSVNVTPTWSLLDIFTKEGLEQYIYFSTTQVYGKLQNGLIDEKYPTDSGNAYGLTHALSEMVCSYYNRNSSTACTVFRLSNSYGSPVIPNDNCWSLVINELCKSAYIDGKIKLLSDGTPLRDFIHGSDICQATALLIEIENTAYKKDVYNLCSGTSFTIMELALKVQDIYNQRYNKEIDIELPQGYVRKDLKSYADGERYSIVNNRLKRLNFNPAVSLDNGINDLFNYLEHHHEQFR
jgi:UDP-glucose 4-epimerase